MLERAEELGRIKPTSTLIELALTLQVVEQFPAIHCAARQINGGELLCYAFTQSPHRGALTKRHNEIQLVGCLERELERHDERVVDEREHGAFGEDMRDLAGAGCDVGLTDGLERVYALRVLLADLHDLAERAFTYDLEEVKLLNRERLVPCRLEVDLEVERA